MYYDDYYYCYYYYCFLCASLLLLFILLNNKYYWFFLLLLLLRVYIYICCILFAVSINYKHPSSVSMNFTLVEGGPRRINPQYFDDFRSSEKKNYGEADQQVKQWGSLSNVEDWTSKIWALKLRKLSFNLITGWWFETCFFPSIGNVIIPTDYYFSERLKPPISFTSLIVSP